MRCGDELKRRGAVGGFSEGMHKELGELMKQLSDPAH